MFWPVGEMSCVFPKSFIFPLSSSMMDAIWGAHLWSSSRYAKVENQVSREKELGHLLRQNEFLPDIIKGRVLDKKRRKAGQRRPIFKISIILP